MPMQLVASAAPSRLTSPVRAVTSIQFEPNNLSNNVLELVNLGSLEAGGGLQVVSNGTGSVALLASTGGSYASAPGTGLFLSIGSGLSTSDTTVATSNAASLWLQAENVYLDVGVPGADQGSVFIGNYISLANSNFIKLTASVGNNPVTIGPAVALSLGTNVGLNLTTKNNGPFQFNGSAGTAGQVLTSNGASLPATWQAAGGSAAEIFGDGSDGAVSFDGTTTYAAFATTTGVAPNLVYTLQRDVMATNITISGGITVNSGGFRVFCTGTLAIAGALQNNGGNASGTNNATGGTSGLRGSYGAATNAPGATGVAGAGGLPGTVPTNSIGGGGGAGGVGGTAGGTAGGATNPASAPSAAVAQSIHAYPFAMMGAGFGPSAWIAYGIGNGASSGAGDGTNHGGGGGGGGGGVIVLAAILSITVNNGISATGGNGGTPTTAGAVLGVGGGGGGGGGFILVITGSDISTHPVTSTGATVAGGAFGTGLNGTGGTGAGNGVAGTAGTIVLIVV